MNPEEPMLPDPAVPAQDPGDEVDDPRPPGTPDSMQV
jgi:hypothetical protein